MEHDAGLLATRSPGTGYWGESDDLPQSESPSGMQAVCCLSPTLVIGPRDQLLGEFRLRPDGDSDKGTGAKRRQVVRPNTLSRGFE
ncbi:hypothetical protein CA948_17395 [Alcaligenes aquatilis]|nr:hypothetical protein CA948_17395 [Alcaligenes aquatilis]